MLPEMRAASDAESLAISRETALRVVAEEATAEEDHHTEVVPTEIEDMAEEKRESTQDQEAESTEEDLTADHPTQRDERNKFTTNDKLTVKN